MEPKIPSASRPTIDRARSATRNRAGICERGKKLRVGQWENDPGGPGSCARLDKSFRVSFRQVFGRVDVEGETHVVNHRVGGNPLRHMILETSQTEAEAERASR